jgi:hypothetical protein
VLCARLTLLLHETLEESFIETSENIHKYRAVEPNSSSTHNHQTPITPKNNRHGHTIHHSTPTSPFPPHPSQPTSLLCLPHTSLYHPTPLHRAQRFHCGVSDRRRCVMITSSLDGARRSELERRMSTEAGICKEEWLDGWWGSLVERGRGGVGVCRGVKRA